MAAARTAASASAPRRPHPPASGDGHRRREGERGRRRARISPPPPPSSDLRSATVRQGLVRRDGMLWKPQPCPRTRRRSHRPRPHPVRRRSTQRERGSRERTERLRERGRAGVVRRELYVNKTDHPYYSKHYFSTIDLLFYPRLRKIILKIENFPLFSCADPINFSMHPVHLVPPFSTHFLPVPLKLVPLGFFTFLAVGSVLVSRPFYDNIVKILIKLIT